MSPNQTSQPRTQCENLCLRIVETAPPLRGIALIVGKYDLTNADAQEATVRACRSANPGIIIVYIPRTASSSHFGFCMSLCTRQHERSALHIMILTDSEETLSEEQFLALETLHRSKESAWLGRDLRPMGRARWDSNIPAMSRARVWEPFIHSGSTYPARGDFQIRIVAQGRVLAFVGDSDTWRSLQPRNAICAEIARHGG